MNKNLKLDYVLWEITQKCNLRCIHCRADASPDIEEQKIIEGKDIYRLIDQIKALGSPTLALTGGEPLLRPDIVEIVKYASFQRIPVRIQSNGLLLTKKLAIRLKKAGIISFGIGIDGSKPEIHDKIRNKAGVFLKIIDVIKLLKSIGMKVHAEYTITKLNYSDLHNTLDLLESLKVDTFLARAAIFAGRSIANNKIFRISSKEYKAILEQLSIEKQKRKMVLNSQDPLYHLADEQIVMKMKQYGNIYSGKVLCGCSAGLNMLHIHNDGKVGICTFLPDIIIGDFFKQSLTQIWRDRFKIFDINRLVNRQFDGKCGKCSDRFICGGCRARALTLDHNLFGCDPYCWKH